MTVLGKAGDPCQVPGCEVTEGTRLYVHGRVLCIPHSPAGKPLPRPPAGTTLADRLAARGMDRIGNVGVTPAPEDPRPQEPRRAPNFPVGVYSPTPEVERLKAANLARVQGAAGRAPRTVSDPYVRDGRTATSFAAAVKALPKSGTRRRAVLDGVLDAHRRGYGGACDVELIRHLGIPGNTVRPRRGELVEMGLLEDSGRTRQHDGTAHTVWQPTRAALTALRRDTPAEA